MVFTVAEYIEVLNTFFKSQEARVTGEIAELKRAASGHVYFTIKDKADGAVLDSIIWKRNYELCGVALEVGMEVILSGHPNIYPPSGRLSFVADAVELVGEGALKKAYDALKKKLEAEGVFAEERKRPLPEYPTKIGVITSMKGAVIHDFENNLGKFGFKVRVIDSRVEGQQAIGSLMDAFEIMHEEAVAGNIEALVVIRGGGSLESLQAFNNENLVRAIVDFPVPVIAGIGHDKDVPLAALAADAMCSTPTATAHLLGETWEDAYAKVREFAGIMNRIPLEIERARNDLQSRWDDLTNAFDRTILRAKEILALAGQAVKHNDPVRQLALGYSIARAPDGRIVRSVKGLAEGDIIELQVKDGKADTTINKIHGKN